MSTENIINHIMDKYGMLLKDDEIIKYIDTLHELLMNYQYKELMIRDIVNYDLVDELSSNKEEQNEVPE